ncbi:MAG: ABC transporter ATP-binding protein [Desulfovibrionaceae bacterium]|nr:ABC transporter ATP-binding protein [Desulfovibrionaceae bacterium]
MLKISNLSCGYGQKTILRGLNLNASKSELIAILGANGSGKTTLLKAITGLVKVSSGQIKIHDRDASKMSARDRAKYIATVPQKAQIPADLTVHDLVLLGRYAHLPLTGIYGQTDYEQAKSALDATCASHLANRPIANLSGGEFQRVLLATALAQDTSIILLDELAAGIDIAGMILLFDLLKKLAQNGKCIIAVMHDYNWANVYATRLIGLKDGQILFDGPKKTYFQVNYLSKLYDLPITIYQPTPEHSVALPTALLTYSKCQSD